MLALKMMKEEWAARADALMSELPHWAAHAVLRDMLALLPQSPYSRALGVGTLDKYAASVFLNLESAQGRKVKMIHADSMLLTVKAKRSRTRPPKAVKILEAYNPWTTRTLPFVPDKKEATIISRKVKAQQIARIEKTKRGQFREYTDRLSAVGVKPSSKKEKGMALLKGIKTIPDLAMEGAAMEFGLKRKAIPHWKPALMKLTSSGIGLMAKRPELWKVLMDPSFKAWVKWPNKEKSTLSAADARKVEAFIRALNFQTP